MTRTPDEIKKGLECCSRAGYCHTCPYDEECRSTRDDACPMHMDALALIQQHEAHNTELLEKVEQLQAERDQLRSTMEETSRMIAEYMIMRFPPKEE